MKWIPFDPEKFGWQKLPAERRCVLLAFAKLESETVHKSARYAVGYLRYGAGDAQSPQWITPGIGGIPTHWCDCLEQPFTSPHWAVMEEHGFPARYSGTQKSLPGKEEA